MASTWTASSYIIYLRTQSPWMGLFLKKEYIYTFEINKVILLMTIHMIGGAKILHSALDYIYGSFASREYLTTDTEY